MSLEQSFQELQREEPFSLTSARHGEKLRRDLFDDNNKKEFDFKFLNLCNNEDSGSIVLTPFTQNSKSKSNSM